MNLRVKFKQRNIHSVSDSGQIKLQQEVHAWILQGTHVMWLNFKCDMTAKHKLTFTPLNRTWIYHLDRNFSGAASPCLGMLIDPEEAKQDLRKNYPWIRRSGFYVVPLVPIKSISSPLGLTFRGWCFCSTGVHVLNIHSQTSLCEDYTILRHNFYQYATTCFSFLMSGLHQLTFLCFSWCQKFLPSEALFSLKMSKW